MLPTATGEVMRRRYRSTSNDTDWLTRFTSVWPIVHVEPQPDYVSVFAPHPVTFVGGLQPPHLNAILAVADEPAVHLARQRQFTVPSPPKFSSSIPPEPKPPGEQPRSSAEPLWRDFEPKEAQRGLIGTLSSYLSGEYGKARARYEAEQAAWERQKSFRRSAEEAYWHAHEQFEKQTAAHNQQREELERERKRETTNYSKYVQRVEAERAADLAAYEKMLAGAAAGEAAAIETTAVQCCLAIPLPLNLPGKPTAHFEDVDGILLLTVPAPNMEEVGLFVQLKTKARAASEKELRAAQEFVVHVLALRVLHEVFATPELSHVQMAGVNMTLAYTERRNGKRMNEIIASVAATRDEFAGVDVAHVDARLCFRALKGVATPSFHEPAAVRPFLKFGETDGRIIESREVVDALEQQTNLAALDWEDFEHIVRELFAKLFSSRAGAEVHVTRASRDYGVDALIFDPDPIHGGKFVIQAKRYVNTVDVAAIRDLFGTVQNEGANRGYIVTTSSYGPEAHAFAKGKPLTLIDGTHLLQLLKEHGYAFRINLQEARQILHGR